MKRFFRWPAMAVAVLVGLAAVPARAAGEEAGVIKVEDKAGLFSDDGISKAKHAFESTTFKSKTHLLVVTADHVPPMKKAEWDTIVAAKDDKSRNRFAEDWARALGRTQDVRGDIVVLVYRSPTGGFFVSTISDKESDVHRHFSDAKAREVDGIFLRELREVKTEKLAGDAAKKELDSALVSATELIIKDLKDTAAPSAGHKSTTGGKRVAADHKAGGIGGYICMILMVLLGAWLVIGLIRAFTGGGGGGGPGGGYGGGPGGGGFLTSLMGGMFGAMAGMWMYNQFFGHDTHSEAMAGDNYGNESGDTGDGNYDDGAAATDGDWGDDGGATDGDWGGDWGGGGGDFGGGGDW